MYHRLGGKVNIIPENRHLLVQPVEEERGSIDTVQLLMPADFKPVQSQYVICDVLGVACDSKFHKSNLEKIVIERRMLHEVTIGLETHYLVLENYVFGRLQ
jgi:hypothetical protein|tara:strand:- start:795 stop:1097 length:303 start_codon:yes stop_codon:yes gene_type:complete